MSQKRRKRYSPEQIVKKLRDTGAMLPADKEMAAVLQDLEVSESTLDRWRKQYGGMKPEEAVRFKKLEDENKRLKQLVADLSLDNQALKAALLRADGFRASESRVLRLWRKERLKVPKKKRKRRRWAWPRTAATG